MEETKRRATRYPIFAIAELELSDREHITTMVDNISLYGIGLYSFVPLKKGEPVSLNIKFVERGGGENSDRVEGEVAWSIKQDDIYFVGVAFTRELSPVNQPRLYEYFISISSYYNY
ncbi:MAG: PilZ domain-containing protein [Nitrospirae bacterium]|nr:MAG: PilZ domain-containing protein [Nitrospirota bacterium]